MEICRQVGINHSLITRWLKGQLMSERNINKIAEAYKLSPGMTLEIINARRTENKEGGK